MNCMGELNHKIDLVNYTVDSMNLDVKTEMESTYAGHISARDHNPVIQPPAIQALLLSIRKEGHKQKETTFFQNHCSACCKRSGIHGG